jgi:predicted nuclease with TOPRIM domain
MNTVSFISKKYDEINEKVVKMEGEKREIIDENKRMKSEIFNMSNELKEMKESFNTLEQYSRRDCVEVDNILII